MPKQFVFLTLLFVFLSGCGGGSSSNNNSNENTDLQTEIDQLFPFTIANNNFDITFQCQRLSSALTYYFDFQNSGVYDVYITLDNGQDVSFSGTYTYQNDEIRMQSTNNILPMDEISTQITPKMGLIASFNTPSMQCIIYGHDYNPVETSKQYRCPTINIGTASFEDNSLEFILPNGLPFNLPVPGAIFRQKDVSINGLINPVITQGYGIYRRSGNTFYADFGTQFNDVNLLKGEFINSDLSLSIDQLVQSAGDCILQ